MQIIMNPNELSNMLSVKGDPKTSEDVYTQACVLLKNIVNKYWESPSGAKQDSSSQDKENVSLNSNSQNQNKPTYTVSEEGKDLVKANIFSALDLASSKRIS